MATALLRQASCSRQSSSTDRRPPFQAWTARSLLFRRSNHIPLCRHTTTITMLLTWESNLFCILDPKQCPFVLRRLSRIFQPPPPPPPTSINIWVKQNTTKTHKHELFLTWTTPSFGEGSPQHGSTFARVLRSGRIQFKCVKVENTGSCSLCLGTGRVDGQWSTSRHLVGHGGRFVSWWPRDYNLQPNWKESSKEDPRMRTLYRHSYDEKYEHVFAQLSSDTIQGRR